MIDVIAAGGLVVSVGAAWTFAVYKYARKGTVPQDAYDRITSLYGTALRRGDDNVAELSMTKEQLGQRERKLQMLETEHRELDRRFNESVATQAQGSIMIADLMSENATLKQEVELLRSVAPSRKRSAKIVE